VREFDEKSTNIRRIQLLRRMRSVRMVSVSGNGDFFGGESGSVHEERGARCEGRRAKFKKIRSTKGEVKK
jgi:hypothetical protein